MCDVARMLPSRLGAWLALNKPIDSNNAPSAVAAIVTHDENASRPSVFQFRQPIFDRNPLAHDLPFVSVGRDWFSGHLGSRYPHREHGPTPIVKSSQIHNTGNE